MEIRLVPPPFSSPVFLVLREVTAGIEPLLSHLDGRDTSRGGLLCPEGRGSLREEGEKGEEDDDEGRGAERGGGDSVSTRSDDDGNTVSGDTVPIYTS